nr:MAG: RNA-dependent RNA polymerase [Mitovirus sp.]
MLKQKLLLAGRAIALLNKVYLHVSVSKAEIQDWIDVILKREATRGGVETIGWLKAVRLSYTRYLCGTPLESTPGFGIQLDGRGLPTGIPIIELGVSRDKNSVRLLLTLLCLSRLIPGWKNPDLTPITGPCEVKITEQLLSDFTSTVKELGWTLTIPVWDSCHVSTKSGPNAQAMIGSIEDAHLLTPAQISALRVCGGEKVISLIELIRSLRLLTWLEKFTIKVRGKEVMLRPKGLLGKLSLIKDKESKCRVIAILDYWTQSVLKPLHDVQFTFLKSLRPDCTHNQVGFKAKLPPSGPYHSLDLSSATDRFPCSVQEAVLAAMTSKEYAAAWRTLLVDRDYKTTWGDRSSVRYACGQPMGAYSSWSTFAIAHHVVVRLAAKRAHLPISFSNYVLLGDDIVIANDSVAREYRAIMKELGVSISEMKTHVSKYSCEFAKRWMLFGVEVTPAPLGSLIQACRFKKETKAIAFVSYYEVATWLREVENRWLPRNTSLGTRSLFADIFLAIGVGAYRFRLSEKAWKFFLLPSREDSRLLRMIKCDTLGSIILGGILGCSHFRKSAKFIGIYLNECKARVLEAAIKNQLGTLGRFQLELPRFLDLVPEGLDAQSILFALPPFAAVRENIAQLQLEFDKAHRVRESDTIAHWLHLDVRLFLDPFAAFSVRRSKTVAMTKATILNYLTAMTRGIAAMRSLAVTHIELEQFVHIMQNTHVVPTRGRPRKKVKSTVKASSNAYSSIKGVPG